MRLERKSRKGNGSPQLLPEAAMSRTCYFIELFKFVLVAEEIAPCLIWFWKKAFGFGIRAFAFETRLMVLNSASPLWKYDLYV